VTNRIALSLALTFALAAAASAQQLYRWTDEKGRVHVTDSPPPANAKDVQKKSVTASAAPATQLPFELTQAVKDFPVTLYSAPQCRLPCEQARALLNKRGVPFKEVQVWDPESEKQLKEISGEQAMVPTLTVGRSVQKGYQAEAFDALLDSARYPQVGVAPARKQAAPPVPKEYQDPAKAKADAAQPEAAPTGRYAAKAPAKPQAEPPRRYAPIPGKDQPVSGPYGKPAEEAPAETPSQPELKQQFPRQNQNQNQ
jgi:glutaredoxin